MTLLAAVGLLFGLGIRLGPALFADASVVSTAGGSAVAGESVPHAAASVADAVPARPLPVPAAPSGRDGPAVPAVGPGDVPATGPGRYLLAHASRAAASSSGRLVRFDVRVEVGVGLDPEEVATAIAATVNDERSWRGTGRWRFELVDDPRRATLHAYLVTPGTTDRLCWPLLTRGRVSCQNGNRVVLNAQRWVRGAASYRGDVASYRQYLVNHEFGHALGHQHVGCPGAGRPAPVMMQQTKGLQGCRANPWPLRSGG